MQQPNKVSMEDTKQVLESHNIHSFCHTCKKKLCTKEELLNHVECQSHQVPSEIKISHIAANAQIDNDMQSSEERWVCTKCYLAFETEDLLQKHELEEHEEDTVQECDKCKLVFARREQLSTHEQTCATGEEKDSNKVKISNDLGLASSKLQPGRLTHDLFLCDICFQVFSSEELLSAHSVWHTEKKPHRCDVCGDIFQDEKKFENHKKLHDKKSSAEPESCVCGICYQTFVQEKLADHMATHSGEKPYKCVVCEKTFSKHKKLLKHQQKHSELEDATVQHLVSSLSAYYAQSAFESGNSQNKEDKPYRCEDCQIEFSSEGNYIEHAVTHSAHKCTICYRTFSSKRKCNEHMYEKHKLYACEICDKTFTRKSSFMQHVNAHDTSKPFHCAQCDKRFSTKYPYDRHMFSMHSTTTIRHGCTKCGAQFTTKSELNRHLSRHAIEKPFNCTKCSQCFSTEIALISHARTHEQDGHMRCSYCLKVFYNKDQLREHELTHYDERPHECGQCNEAFVTKCKLLQHEEETGHHRPLPRKLKALMAVRTVFCHDCNRVFPGKDELLCHKQHAHSDSGNGLKKESVNVSISIKQRSANEPIRIGQESANVPANVEQRSVNRPIRIKQESVNISIRNKQESANKAIGIRQESVNVSSDIKQSVNTPMKIKQESSNEPRSIEHESVNVPLNSKQKSLVISTNITQNSVNTSIGMEQESEPGPVAIPINIQPESVNEELLRDHSEDVEKKPYRCGVCGDIFQDEKEFEDHANLHDQINLRERSKQESVNIPANIKQEKADEHFNLGQENVNVPINFKQEDMEIPEYSQTTNSELSIEQENFDGLYAYDIRNKTIARRQHVKSHNKTKPYHCTQCDKRYSIKFLYDRHLFSVHCNSTTQHQCTKCGAQFATKSELNRHMSRHAMETVEHSRTTDGKQERISNDNEDEHSEKPTAFQSSEQCLQSDSEQSDVHMIEQSESHSVEQSDSYLMEQSAQKPYRCDMCGKRFQYRRYLVDHQRVMHSDKKSHQCILCGRAFVKKSALMEHMMTHNAVKTHRCGQCQKSYHHKHDLKYHVQSHHVAGKFKCDVCEASFNSEMRLSLHTKVHGEELSPSTEMLQMDGTTDLVVHDEKLLL